MGDFTNYYEVSMSRALQACNERLKFIDDKMLPMANACLEREKRDNSQQMFRDRRFNPIWWGFHRWFTKPGDLMLWCMANPGHDLSMWSDFKCDNVVRAIKSVRGDIANVQMNCERIAGEKATVANVAVNKMLMKQSDHSWLFASDPWENLTDSLDPWATELENEAGDA